MDGLLVEAGRPVLRRPSTKIHVGGEIVRRTDRRFPARPCVIRPSHHDVVPSSTLAAEGG